MMEKRDAIGGALLILAAFAFSRRADAAPLTSQNFAPYDPSREYWGAETGDFVPDDAPEWTNAPDEYGYQGEAYAEDFSMNDPDQSAPLVNEYVGDLPPEDYELTPEAAAAPEVVKEGPGIFATLVSTGGGGDVFDALANPNVQAFLAMIREFESRGQYNVVFGGKTFDDFSDHPHIAKLSRWGWTSAAGAYQIMARSPIPGTDRWTKIDTWGEIQKKLNLPDFSPESQDIAAVFLLKRRGALPSILRGDFDTAINKVRKEWASLPGAGYGQPEASLKLARDTYAANGGNFETV